MWVEAQAGGGLACNPTQVWKVLPRRRHMQTRAKSSLVSVFHSFLTLGNPWRPQSGSPTNSDGQETRAPAKHSGYVFSESSPVPSSLKTAAGLTKGFASTSLPQRDGPRTQAGPGKMISFYGGEKRKPRRGRDLP